MIRRISPKKKGRLSVPEKLVKSLVQSLADTDAQIDGGIVVPLFDGIYGLA